MNFRVCIVKWQFTFLNFALLVLLQKIMNLVTKAKRRPRTKRDALPRNFICGCGLSYFVYASLHTHIKGKHQGEVPEGTISGSGKQKRGRPKKCHVVRPQEGIQLANRAKSPEKKIIDHQMGLSLYELYPSFDYIMDLYLKDVSNTVDLYSLRVLEIFTSQLRNYVEMQTRQGAAIRSMCGSFSCEGFSALIDNFIEEYLPQHCPILDRKSAQMVALHLDRWLRWRGLVNSR